MNALMKIAFVKKIPGGWGTVGRSTVGALAGAYAGKKYNDMTGDPNDQQSKSKSIGMGMLGGAVAGPVALPAIGKVLKTNHRMSRLGGRKSFVDAVRNSKRQ